MSDFTIKDKRNLINLCGKTPTLDISKKSDLYGVISDFSFRLIEEIRKRNFDIPNMNFSFYTNNGEIVLCGISGKNFRLHIHNNIITSYTIPKIEINLYEDYSGPSAKVYIGTNWKKDEKLFNYGHNMKLHKKKRIMLCYCGEERVDTQIKEETYHKINTRKRKINNILKTNEFDFNKIYDIKEYLKNDDDLDRNYTPLPKNKNEMYYYYTNDFLFDVLTWVYNNVYKKILEIPIPEYKTDSNLFKEPEKILFEKNFNWNLYTIVDDYDYKSISDNDGIKPNIRLLSLGYSLDKKYKYSDIVNDGFIWCSTDEIHNLKEKFKYNYNKKIVFLNLKFANEVYVINSDSNDTIEQAKSMVHINDYNNEYEKPKIVVRRYIRKDEIKEIKKI